MHLHWTLTLKGTRCVIWDQSSALIEIVRKWFSSRGQVLGRPLGAWSAFSKYSPYASFLFSGWPRFICPCEGNSLEKLPRCVPGCAHPHLLCTHILPVKQISIYISKAWKCPASEYPIHWLQFYSQCALCSISYLEQSSFFHTAEQFGFGCYTVVVCSFLEMSHDKSYCAINIHKTMTFEMRRKCEP